MRIGSFKGFRPIRAGIVNVSGWIRRIAANEVAATSMEYCLIASLVSIVVLTSVQMIGLDVVKFISMAVVGLK